MANLKIYSFSFFSLFLVSFLFFLSSFFFFLFHFLFPLFLGGVYGGLYKMSDEAFGAMMQSGLSGRARDEVFLKQVDRVDVG